MGPCIFSKLTSECFRPDRHPHGFGVGVQRLGSEIAGWRTPRFRLQFAILVLAASESDER